MDDDTNEAEPINYVATRQVNIREAASTDSKVVGTLEPGQRVAVESISDGWASTDAGHVMADYLEEDDQ